MPDALARLSLQRPMLGRLAHLVKGRFGGYQTQGASIEHIRPNTLTRDSDSAHNTPGQQ
jgi:hypothetical protein